ncbi:MAG: hypothetical protein ACTSSH_05880 [Candidatus Heimdallarchaeota archaeon]
MVGTSYSTRSKIEVLLDIIAELEADMKGQAVPLHSVIEKAQEAGMSREFIERNIERMRQDGMLFQPKSGFIKRA